MNSRISKIFIIILLLSNFCSIFFQLLNIYVQNFLVNHGDKSSVTNLFLIVIILITLCAFILSYMIYDRFKQKTSFSMYILSALFSILPLFFLISLIIAYSIKQTFFNCIESKKRKAFSYNWGCYSTLRICASANPKAFSLMPRQEK